ncbi:MAG: ABC transporter ATP-binding protein [Spirochaetales bacterium]
MHPIRFEQVSFQYEQTPVITSWTLDVPAGITSLTGPNGSGKSTFLILASGRFLPAEGTVLLQGRDTRSLDETTRNRLASLLYQNMEFENEEPLGELLEYVQSVGFLTDRSAERRASVTKIFELDALLSRKTQQLSKGEMQRAVMAFSLLYGSSVVVMDEPIFALEDHQKHKALKFLGEFTQELGVSFLFSVHELELTRQYSQNVLLFSKDAPPLVGPTLEVLSRENLEAAYQVPAALLHQKERLYRDSLLQEKK